MIFRLRKAMGFTKYYVALVHHVFASGGEMPGLTGSDIHEDEIIRPQERQH